MRRRDFIAALSGAVAWPSAVTAQVDPRTYRVGLLTPGPPFTPDSGNGLLLFQALASRGYVLDRNLLFESRSALTRAEPLPSLLDELVATKLDLIITVGYPAALVAKQRSGMLPVVVIGAGDPVATGLVESLSRPGGHVTGVTEIAADLSAKRLELLKAAVPSIKRVAMLWNADDLAMTLRYRAAETVAPALGLAITPLGVRAPEDFEEAFASMRRDPPDAILMVTDVRTGSRRNVSSGPPD